MRALLLPLLTCSCLLLGQEDPFTCPQEAREWARRVAMPHATTRSKLQALLAAIFEPESASTNGLGVVYDNTRTRTIGEVWTERRANCLSLTAFFMAACRAVGIEARYAEPLNTNRWKRIGSLVRLERHVVTMVPIPPIDDVIADFLPQLRRRVGTYIVTTLSEARFRSLFHANRAVELMDQGLHPEALEQAHLAVQVDPTSSSGWNVQGVIKQALGKRDEAEVCFRRAIALDPRDGTPVGNLEQLCRIEGRFEEAIYFSAIGAGLRKKDPYYHAFLAEEAFDTGRFEDAQKSIKTALKLQPHEPEFHLLQARLHLQAGQVEAATKSLEAARRWAMPEERERYDSKLTALRK